MLGRILQGCNETIGHARRILQNLGFQGGSSGETASGADQDRTFLSSDESLCLSRTLPVRIRCVKGLYLAALSSPTLADGERMLLAVKRHLGSASVTVLLMHAPDVDSKPWKLTDLHQRRLHLEQDVGISEPGAASLEETNSVTQMMVTFEPFGDRTPKAYTHIRVGARYLSVNPSSGKVSANRTRANYWECFQLEPLPTHGIDRPLHRVYAFSAFLRARNSCDSQGGWLWCTVLFSGQLVALPWEPRLLSNKGLDVIRPAPFFFEYSDASRTALLRDVSGRYLHATEDGGKHVVAYSFFRQVAEQFAVRACPRNLIHLESRWGYLSIDHSRKSQNGTVNVRCDRKRADSWETFQIVPVICTGSLTEWWHTRDAQENATLSNEPRLADSFRIETTIELRDGTRRIVKASATIPGITKELAFRTITDYDHYGNFCRGVAVCRTVESHQSERGKISLIRTTQSRSLWIFTVKAQMLLRAEEYKDRGEVSFVFISGQGVRRYAARWDIHENLERYGNSAELRTPACSMSLTIDFQPVIYIPKNWLDAMAISAAKDAVHDMILECKARTQLLQNQK